MQRRDILTGAAGVAVLSLPGGRARAQAAATYPSRPIRLVVGFAPGGPTDLVARLAARAMSANLGQTVVVENRPGASGKVAASFVARTEPDGHTLLANVLADLVGPVLERRTREPLLRVLAPVTLVGTAPNVFVVHPSLGVSSVGEVTALAKARPGSLSYASAGVGTASHLSGVLYSAAAGVDLIHIPYSGTAAAQTDLLTGRVSMMFDNLDNGLSNAAAGKVRALAVTGPTRWHAAPAVPTLGEARLPDSELLSIFGVMAPVGTPGAIVERIASGLAAASRDDETRRGLLAIGIEPAFLGAAEYGRYLASQTGRWEALAAQGRLGQLDEGRPQ